MHLLRNVLLIILLLINALADAQVSSYNLQVDGTPLQTRQTAEIVSKRILYYTGHTPTLRVIEQSGKISIETTNPLPPQYLKLLLSNKGNIHFAAVLEKNNLHRLLAKMDSVCIQHNIGPINNDHNISYSALYSMLVGIGGDDISYLSSNRKRIDEILQHKEIKALYSPYLEYSWKGGEKDWEGRDVETLHFFYSEAYRKDQHIDISTVDSASVKTAVHDNTLLDLNIVFNAKDAEKFSDYSATMATTQSRIGFFIGDYLFTVATVYSRIPNGKLSVGGNFKDATLMNTLCTLIRCEPYPAKVLLVKP